MSEDNLGFCKYCGQSQIVVTVGEVSQEKRNEIATGLCQCAQAQEARRKEDRKKKKEDYLEENFPDDPLKSFVAQCIDAVDTWDMGLESVQLKLDDGYTHKISLDKDYNLKIKATKTNKKETTL